MFQGITAFRVGATMRPWSARLAPLALSCGVAWATSVATAQSFSGLGFLPGGTESYARDVSGDGSVVVGYGFIPPGNSPTTGFRAFRWTSAGGMENLGTLPGGTYSAGRAVSADGSVIVGHSGVPVGSFEFAHASRWTGGVMTDLGTLGGNNSTAYGVSDNGSVVVGYSYLASGFTRAFCWTGGVMTNLGTLPGAGWVSSVAYGVSGNGSVVVGYCNKPQANSNCAFRWTNGVMINLGTLKKGMFSEAWAASANGSVVVGTSDSSNGSRAFRWTGGVMTNLGTLPGQPYSYGRAVSGDGSKVVGYSSDGSEYTVPASGSVLSTGRAFLWTAALGMVDLNTYLGVDPAHWTLREARGISADGSTVVGWGWHDGEPEAWIAHLP